LPALTRRERCRMLFGILRCRVVELRSFELLLNALESIQAQFVAESLRKFVNKSPPDVNLNSENAAEAVAPLNIENEITVVEKTQVRQEIADICCTDKQYGGNQCEVDNRVAQETRFSHLSGNFSCCDLMVTNVAYRLSRTTALWHNSDEESAGYRLQQSYCSSSVASTSPDVVQTLLPKHTVGRNVQHLTDLRTSKSLCSSAKNEIEKSGKCSNFEKVDQKDERMTVGFGSKDLTVCLPRVFTLPSSLPPSNNGQHYASQMHKELFDNLCVIVNTCDWASFTSRIDDLRPSLTTDPDATCIVLHLEITRLMRSEFGECKQAI